MDTPDTLARVHIYNRVGPKYPKGAVRTTSATNNEVLFKEYPRALNVFTCKGCGSGEEKQPVLRFGGFISVASDKSARQSTIDYITNINQPFTEYLIIKVVLKQSENATMELGQDYILNTFDLGGCMKALPFIWTFLNKYRKHTVCPGVGEGMAQWDKAFYGKSWKL